MLACTAMLVGCTDDDVIENSGQSTTGKEMNAYVSLSINASTNSSRGETYGDSDGSAEDSGHENAGTTDENNVSQVMVILALQDKEGVDNSKYGIIEPNSGITFQQSQTISNPRTYQVQKTGTYDALVVINPIAGLLDEVNSAKNPREAYNTVLNYDYKYESEADVEATNESAINDYTKNKTSFMMANQVAVPISVDESNNSVASAATATIDVERAISKITFRPTNNNAYPVTITKDVYNPVTEDGWFISGKTTDDDGKDVAEWSHTEFNRANNNTYWVRVQAGLSPSDLGQVLQKDFSTKFVGIYTIGENSREHKGYINGELKEDYVFTLVPTENLPAQIVLDKGEQQDEPREETYFVKLEKYSLTNLSNSIFAVRHKISATATDWSIAKTTALGQLTTTENLVDPNSNSKNSAITENAWNSGYNAIDFFYNPLEKVAEEAETLITGATTTLTYFKDLSALVNDSKQEVTGDEHNGSTNPGIGQFMSYCFENAVKQDMQVNGLVTGIIFAGQIYTDAACTKAVDVMYKYGGAYYRELGDLVANNSTVEFKDASGKKVDLSAYSTDDVAASVVGLDVYKNGKCFYYSNKIKHYDNVTIDENGERNENGTGVMEFAIMRNNIYSLAIGTISDIGSSTVEPLIGTPAEDTGAYITMRARILPWIVRFNDINF